MDNDKLLNNTFIILVILLMATMYTIYKMYQTNVNSKNFIICVYLYVLLSLFFVSIIGQYTATLSITNSENVGKMAITYLILAFSGICLILNDNIFVNHFGLLLLCISIGLTIGVTYKNSKNISDALMITGIIVFTFTMIAFSSNENQLLTFDSWIPKLTFLLCVIIIIELLYFVFYGINKNFPTIISGTVVLIFIAFILSDTSKLILDSKSLSCRVHSCINYPEKVVGLLLDYINIFVNLNSNK